MFSYRRLNCGTRLDVSNGHGLPEEPRAGLGPNPVVAEKVGHRTNLGGGLLTMALKGLYYL